MIPEALKQDIKNRAEIVDVVGQFLTLKKAGTRYLTHCPFHEERTPSFYVTPGKQMFKCFGCGKGGDVFTFLMEYNNSTFPDALQWVAGYYGFSMDGNAGTYTPPVRRAAPVIHAPALPPSFIDPAIFQKSLSRYESNNLVKWMCEKLGETVVMDAVKTYQVGTAQNGGTVFWLINHAGQTGTGKVMYYPPNDHHRDKSKVPTWAHSKTGMTDPEKYNWVKYWFGEHLLSVHPMRTVAIVESEKTAVVCSIYFSYWGYVWVASGGIDGLNNREKWQVLKGRTVILFPDLAPPNETGKTPFQDWSAKTAEMQHFGINAIVNNFLESRADQFERAQKWDLADVLLVRDLAEFQKEQHEPKTTENARRLPAAQQNAVDLLGRYQMRLIRIEPITA